MRNCVQENSLLVQEQQASLLSKDHPIYGKLVLEDGTAFDGISFGSASPIAGEVVFGTGMVGYPEALTDPSFTGQILTMTYPIIGNYGVPPQSLWEDDHIHVAGLIVSNYIDIPSHVQSTMNLGSWLQQEKIPALEIKDTRLLTQHIRTHGTMLGKIVFDTDIPYYDPDGDNLVAQASTRRLLQEGSGDTTIVLLDCGAKRKECACDYRPLGFSPFCARREFRL